MQEKSKIKRKIKYINNRIGHKVNLVLNPVLSWVYFRWFTEEPTGKGHKLYWGFKELLWSYICGNSIWFSFHIASIYWGIGK